MIITTAWEIICLFLLGLAGGALFSRLRLPAAPLLGTLTVLTAFRAFGIAIPSSPSWLLPLLQVLIGIHVGSMVTREAARAFKMIMVPAATIVLWVFLVIFLIGPLLALMTMLDLHTALLSLSMGGLEVVLMLALDVESDTEFVIIMQILRVIACTALYPFLFDKWGIDQKSSRGISERLRSHDPSFDAEGNSSLGKYCTDDFKERTYSYMLSFTKILTSVKENTSGNPLMNKLISQRILMILIASAGGGIFHYLGVPSGFMIGAIFTVALVSLAGAKTVSIPPRTFNLILVGMGITVSDNILPERFAELTDYRLLIPVAIATVFIFISSFLVALLVHRVSGRDLPTSLLAAAPGRLTVITVIAIKYDKDPFFVSILHLCRLLSLYIVLPFVFMYFM